MPDYRLVFFCVYRVAATGDNHAAQRVRDDLVATFPGAKFDIVTTDKSASQTVSGSTTYDVDLLASGVTTDTSVSASLNNFTPPATLSPSGAVRQSFLLAASVDTRVLDHFRN